MFERFTDKGRVVLVRTQEIGRELHSPWWRRHHMLLALIDGANDNPEDNVAALFDSAGVDRAAFRATVLASLQASETALSESEATRPFSSGAKKALELALREALSLGHNYIASSHLLLAILRSADGALAEAIGTTGLNYGTAREFVRQNSPEGGRGRGRGRARGRGPRARGRGTEGFDAVLRRAKARAAATRPTTTGDLLVALTDVPGTHFASILATVPLPDPTALGLEADRLINAGTEDGPSNAVRIDPETGSVTVHDPELASALRVALDQGESPRAALRQLLVKLGLVDDENIDE